MMKTLCLKQLQVTQEEKLTDCRISEMEIHCVKPKTLDH